MATNTFLITQVTGQAWVRGTDGTLNPLKQGMRIPADADVVTATGASVQLQVDGQPLITIGENRDVQLGAEVAQANVDPATAAVAVPAEPDAARVLAALDAGNDPLAELDPTAAVLQGGPGGDGGSSFTRLISVLETTIPLSLEYPRPTFPTTEEIRLGGTGSNRAPEAVGGGLSGTGLLDQLNDDSDVITPVNISEKFTDPDGHALTFTATGLPPGLTLDPITGIISGTLDSSASQGGIGGSGIYNVVITATDPYGASTSLDFTWTTKNPPPVAEDDSATTEENTVVTGNVLGGNNETGAGRDTDPDGDKLTVTEVTNGNGDKVPAGSTISGSNSDSGKGGGSFVINPDGSYSFNPGSDFDYLAAGESTTTTVTYKISDGDGGFDDATLTITITGTNDGPEIISSAGDHATTVTEIIDNATGENTTTHQKTGVIEFSDADDSDTHNVTFTPGNPDYLGEFELVVNADKTIGWTFKVDDSAIDHLAAGETLTQEYTITIDDGKGGKVEQTVTVTIVGTNDAPIINETISEATGAVTEDASESTATGKMDWDDVDNRDTHTWTVKNDGQYGGLTINDKGEWTYTLDNSKANHLPAGKTITDTITVEVDDGNGGTDTKDIVITITGTNDVPVIDDSTVAEGTVKEAGYEVTGTPIVSGELVATDVDDGDVLSWSLVDGAGKDALTLKGEYGSITLDPATNKWTYTLDNKADATQKLNVGDTRTETFKAYVSDGKGGVVEQEIKVTVEGTNDAPIASADTDTVTESGVKKGGNESEAGKSEANGNVLINDTDIDSAKANLKVSEVSFDGIKGAIGTALEGKYGALTLQADGSYKYVLHNNQDNVQNLKAGQTATETFTYTVVDEHGAKHETTLTITVTGTNDSPIITSKDEDAQGAVTEAGNNADGSQNPGNATASGTLTSSDVDVDATATWSVQGTGKYGTISIDPKTGVWTYTLDNGRKETQALKDGQIEKETFVARVQDEHGAWVEKEITVTVMGTNDAPVASGEKVTFKEDPTEGANGNAKVGNVLTNDHNHEGDNLTVKEFTIEGNVDGSGNLIKYPAGNGTVDIAGVGTFVLNKDGSYVFTPKPNYSGNVPKITYTVQEPDGDGESGLTSSADLEFTITPVADAPELVDPTDTKTLEDTSIALGLKAPVVTDNIDHNGAGQGDNPELLGPITLTGIPAGVQLLDSEGNVLFTSDGGPITIVLSNPADGNGHISGATGTLTLTKEQFESLKVQPKAHDGNNFTVKVSVDSYEVDANGNPLPGIPPANTTVDMVVDVQAVTDKVDLTFKDGSEDKSFTMNEDNKFNLSNELKAAFEDLDGSEQRDIVISGLPKGSTVFVNGKAITADLDGNFIVKATGQTGGIDSFPKIEIRPPANFSGDMNDIKVTLNAQDTDKDSGHTIAGESDSVTLDIHVKPIAGDISVGGATGKEDTAIKFLANVKLTDTDGSERITKFVIKGVPEGWVIRDAGGNVVDPDADGNYVLPATGTPPSVNLDAYKGWTATPPAHSSSDATFKLGIETIDVDPVTGESNVVDKDYNLKVAVTPDAEKITGDTDKDGDPDLTMTPGHTYGKEVAGTEDGWFDLNVTDQGPGKDFNLQDGWSNQDGKPPAGSTNTDSADGGTEQTFALLKPVLVNGVDGESAAGAQFSYIGADGNEVILTYNGKDPVEIPMEFLHTVKFKGPAHVSGEFKIEVQAKTVDTDPDTGATSVAVSGKADLDGIFIAPVADKVTLAVGGVDGRAQGDEDTAIGLSIRPTSSDPSETFNVRISDIPTGAVLMYDGVVVEVINGVANIPNFDSSKSLTVTPPPNSNEDFKLKVEAQSVDASPGGATSESAWQEQDLHVRVDGVADKADVTFKKDVSFTEDQLGEGNTISLSDVIADAQLTDNDGSETLTFKITGLPDGFSVEGATFLGGTGEGREWVFTKDQLANIKIKVPEHYSGKLPGGLVAITTENDGHSLTGKPLEWDVNITPSPESDMTTGSTVVEDQRSKLDFSIGNNHGDTNEELTAVRVKVADVEGKDFTLFLGENGPTLAEALEQGLIKLDSTGQYYELRGDDINNVYAQAGNNFAHNKPDAPELSFDVKYEITDYSNDGKQSATEGKDGNHTLTVTPVTDEVGLTVGAITGDGVTGNIADGFTLTQGGKISVDITLVKQPDAAAGGNVDTDGSEQFTQVVITGVPDGMLVDGLNVGGLSIGNVSYLGDGKWVISIPNGQYPQFNGAITGSVQFSAGDRLNGSLKDHPITITVVTQDNGADTTETDSAEWKLSTDFEGEGNGQPTADVSWEQNPDFTGTEDKSFALSDAFTGTVNHPDTTFTVVLTLPEGAKISYDGKDLSPTVVDGKEVWVISGKGDQAALDAFLKDIVVTPPPNWNDNNGGLEFDATFTAHLPNGSQDQGKADGTLPLTPVTDPAVIDVIFSAADADGNPTDDPAQEGRDVAITLNVTSPNDGPTTLGDKLYIKLDEGNGLNGGVLRDADGNSLKLVSVGAGNDMGLEAGDYYVVDLPSGATAPHSVNLTYTPADGQAYNKGSLTVDAWVQNQEKGASNATTGNGTGNGDLQGVNNGFEITVGEQDGAGNWVVTGTENQQGGTDGRIQLDIGGQGLVDADGSEEALVALLKNLPEGFLVYWGNDAGTAVLAGNAGVDANGNNVWNIPLIDGKLPSYISVQPPQNWSGTLEDVHLSVLSGEKGQETREESVAEFDVVVEAKADGILSFSPNIAFGKEGDIIQLNLNIVMADGKPAGTTDQSFETITLTLQGLGEHAAFYVGSELWSGGVSYDALTDTYKLSGLSQADIDKLGFIQAAGAAQDKVIVTVETVESIGGDTSGSVSGEFDLSIADKPATGGDDDLLYDGGLLDGGAGNDTVWLRFGENLDFDDDAAPVNLKNIETLDLTKPGYDHELLNLGADDVLRITDGRNTLTIKADDGDKVSLKEEDSWKLSADKSTDDYDVYTSTSTDGKDVEVRISKGLPVDGLLSDGQESLDALLGDTGAQASPAAARSDTPTTELAGALEPLGGDQQSQLINDLIQQGKLTSEV